MQDKTASNETGTGVKDRSALADSEDHITDIVTSKDGTTIGYLQLGHGPGLVILHGAAESASSHMQLAKALANTFTVYLPDRRGRGLSGPYGKDYSIQEDVEDLDALLVRTGAHYIFGVSSGGIICLQATLRLQTIHKVAIYEPPLFADRSEPEAVLTRFDQEMAQGKVVSAMITAMKGSQMGPPIFNYMPRWLLQPLAMMAMIFARSSKRNEKTNDEVTMGELAPTLHYDFALVVETAGKMESFKAIQTDVLLLGGSKSPAYLRSALDSLEKVLPHRTRVQFPGLGHGGSGNTDRGGKPELVAKELHRFFLPSPNM